MIVHGPLPFHNLERSHEPRRVLPSKEEPEKIEFDLKDDEADSTEEHESEEEDPHTLVLRRSDRERRLPERYSPPYFRSNFSLSTTDDDPRTVKEAVDSEDGNLWKKAIDEEIPLATNGYLKIS